MKIKLKKFLGGILSVGGFFGACGVADTPSHQIIWSFACIACIYVGFKLLEKSGALDEA